MNTLIPLVAAALLGLPAAAQPGPGIAPGTTKATPASAPGRPVTGIGGPAAAQAQGEKPYDEAADAKADVAAAVAKAKAEKKRVLVTIGANWCGWCRTLDGVFKKDATVAAALAKAYVPVKVDVGRAIKNLDLAASWGADPKKKGIPILVVLDGEGKAVKVQDTSVLEAGKKGYDTAKVVAFLEANAPH